MSIFCRQVSVPTGNTQLPYCGQVSVSTGHTQEPNIPLHIYAFEETCPPNMGTQFNVAP